MPPVLTVETALVAAVSALVTVILVLWSRLNRSEVRLLRRIEECERDRKDLWKLIWELNRLVCTMPNCPLRMELDRTLKPHKEKEFSDEP